MANVYILCDSYRIFSHLSSRMFMLIFMSISFVNRNYFLVYGMSKISIYMSVVEILIVRHVDDFLYVNFLC